MPFFSLVFLGPRKFFLIPRNFFFPRGGSFAEWKKKSFEESKNKLPRAKKNERKIKALCYPCTESDFILCNERKKDWFLF